MVYCLPPRRSSLAWCICVGTSWLGRPGALAIRNMESRAGACIVLLGRAGMPSWGSHAGALGLGKGQEHAVWCCAAWRRRLLWLSGELWRMLQLPTHRVISQAGGITVLVAGEAIPAVLGAVSAQVGVRDVFHLPVLSPRAQSPGRGSCSYCP